MSLWFLLRGFGVEPPLEKNMFMFFPEASLRNFFLNPRWLIDTSFSILVGSIAGKLRFLSDKCIVTVDLHFMYI